MVVYFTSLALKNAINAATSVSDRRKSGIAVFFFTAFGFISHSSNCCSDKRCVTPARSGAFKAPSLRIRWQSLQRYCSTNPSPVVAGLLKSALLIQLSQTCGGESHNHNSKTIPIPDISKIHFFDIRLSADQGWGYPFPPSLISRGIRLL